MKKIALWLSLSMVIIIISGIGLLAVLNPTYRFCNRKLPVLASPSVKKQSSDSFPKHQASFNILILALDTWDTTYGRADMIMVVNINPMTKKINIVSIPRDTKVPVEGVGWTKINHLHLLAENKGDSGGTKATMDTVCGLLHRNLNYYIKVNFRGFENFIDHLGGLNITLDYPVNLTYKKLILAKGENHLDGETTLQLVRERYSLKRGDFARQYHQLQVLKALSSQLVKPNNFKRLPELIKKARSNVLETNLSEADFISLASLLRKFPQSNLKYHQISGTSETGLDPLTQTKVYYWNPDLPTVKKLGKDYF